MQMSEELDRLKSLQEVLANKYELEAQVEELPKSLDGETESLDRFKKEYILKNTEYEEKKAQVAQLKLELDEAQKKREEGEKGMDAITTHREYEILQKQIDEAQAVEDEKRKELQKEEKALSELNDLLKEQENSISSIEKDVNESRENLDKEVAQLNTEIVELTKQENDICDGIDQEIIMKFQRIIRRNRKGIVAVTGNVCDGCHMVLPAQFANEVRHGDKILFCPYCSRILYYEEMADADAKFYSLQDEETAEDTDEDLLEYDGLYDDMDGSDETEEGESSGKSLDYND